MPAETSPPSGPSGQTVCGQDTRGPLNAFLRTETGSASVLLLGALAALVWANIAAGSYEALWGTELSIRIGSGAVSLDLREWLNSGLMTLFFFVVGLEARREFDMGELRERRRITLPLLAGLSGMLVPVAIYLSVNAGEDSVHGWGAAMSTDTAFALGMLAVFEMAARQPSGLHPHGRRRRRLPGPGRHRLRLQRSHLPAATADRARALRRRPAGATHPRHANPRAVRAAGHGDLGGTPEVRGGPGGDRPRDGSADLCPPGGAPRPGTCQQAVQTLPRTADPRTRALGATSDRLYALPQRPPPADAAPLDELCDRAAVRPRQRGHHSQRRSVGRCLHVAGHPRHPVRLCPRQAAGHLRRDLAHDTRQRWAPAPAGRLGRHHGRMAPWPGWASPCPC